MRRFADSHNKFDRILLYIFMLYKLDGDLFNSALLAHTGRGYRS